MNRFCKFYVPLVLLGFLGVTNSSAAESLGQCCVKVLWLLFKLKMRASFQAIIILLLLTSDP